MKTLGFPISTKENEKRRAIVPNDIKRIANPSAVYIEKGFGDVLGFKDEDYRAFGCNICSHETAISQDIVCDPKIGDSNYLNKMRKGQIIFGWIHATQNKNLTNLLVERGLKVYAWEKMFDKGRHVFWFNNELAGEAAVMHAFQCYGFLPYGLNVAVLGNGNTARGATRVLNLLGSVVTQYNRRQEQLFKDEIGEYDVIVNCILWDVTRKDHIIYRDDLKRMKRGSLIIDVSCDKNGGIETSVPTTIDNPVYFVDGIMHYCVDHTPSLFYKTFSYNNSKIIIKYLNELMNEEEDQTLKDCLIINNGSIIDEEILLFQKR